MKKLRYAIILYALFDLFIGGRCGGFIPLDISLAAQTTSTLASGGIGVSCNAVTASTSNNPGTSGGCTSFALLTSGNNLPGVYTWQTITTGSPGGVTVNFMGSLDNSTWVQLDTSSSTSGAIRTVTPTAAYRFLGCVPATLSGGSSPTLTCQISVASGGTAINNGSAGAIAVYATASGNTIVSPDATLTDDGAHLTYSGTASLVLPSGTTSAASFQGTGMAAGAGGWFPSTTAFCWNSANVCQSELVGTGFKVGSGNLIGFASTAAATGSFDTGFSRGAAGIVDIGNGTAADTSAKVKAAGYLSVGTTFTSSGGCTEGSLTGGATAGKFTTSGSTGCTTTITMGNSATAANGWQCVATDITTAGDAGNPHMTTSNATTATIATGTIVSGDVISFSCIGY